MIDIFIWLLFLGLGLFVLIKGADIFTDYSEKLSYIFGIPKFIVGVTVIAIGTSLPELATSLIAVFRGSSEFVVGNVVGSNITNIMLIIGITAIVVRMIKIEWDIISIDLPFLLFSAIFLWFVSADGLITPVEGLMGLGSAIIFILYIIHETKKSNGVKKEKLTAKIPLMIILGGVMIYLGAKYTITSVLTLTELFGLSNTSIIALTIVALGTSLPELMVSISAALKKNYEMAMGNVLGSNIFNTFIVIGIPSLFAGKAGLMVSPNIIGVALPFMVAATFLYIVATQDKKVTMYEGLMFVVVYGLFIMKILNLF